MLHALVVGVDNYRDSRIRPLVGAGPDAESVAEYLRGEFAGAATIETLRDAHAVRDRILDSLATIATAIVPGDRFCFYFSGHGTAKRVAPLEPTNIYLATHDTRLDRVEEDALEFHLELPRFLDPIRRTARSALMIVDACFTPAGLPHTRAFVADGSLLLDGVFADKRMPPPLDAALFGRQGAALLAATKVGLPAFEDPTSRRGVFTRRLLEYAATQSAQRPLFLAALMHRVVGQIVSIETGRRQDPTMSAWEAAHDLCFPSHHDLADD